MTAVGDEVEQRVETGCETGVAMLVICGKGNVRAAMMIESRTGRAVERVSELREQAAGRERANERVGLCLWIGCNEWRW